MPQNEWSLCYCTINNIMYAVKTPLYNIRTFLTSSWTWMVMVFSLSSRVSPGMWGKLSWLMEDLSIAAANAWASSLSTSSLHWHGSDASKHATSSTLNKITGDTTFNNAAAITTNQIIVLHCHTHISLMFSLVTVTCVNFIMSNILTYFYIAMSVNPARLTRVH